MKDQGLPLDRISSLPPSIIQTILTRMPMRDAFRTSILSQSWRHHCRNMPTLVFDNFRGHYDPNRSNKCPILGFSLYLYGVDSCWEIDQIILHLSRNYALKAFRLLICSGDEHKLLPAFFTLQQLMVLELQICAFQPPVTFKGFSRLVRLYLHNVSITARDVLRLISCCPLLKDLTLHVTQFLNTRLNKSTIA
ncbi:putative F-box domain, leucine-rich repeat domain superfamily, F-box-like domain superfamily [Helianthus anomalus]